MIQLTDIKINPILEALREKPLANECEKAYFDSFDGTKIFYRTWKPTGKIEKIVVVTHGMAGHGEFFVLLADKLVHHGFMVIVADDRNHGYSEGKRGDIKKFKNIFKDLKLLIDSIKTDYPDVPLFLVGESMGGAVSINFTKLYESELSGVVLFAPAVKIDMGRKFWIAMGLLSPIIAILRVFLPSKPFISVKGSEEEGIKNPIHIKYDKEDPLHLEKVSIRYILQLFKHIRKTLKCAPEITIPTLIFQGADDKAVSPNGAKRFYNHLKSKDKNLIMVEEGYHSLLSDPAFQNKWSILIDWLKAH